jgi:cyclophilin family peptidyl-prolyl cis-trans isomerase
LANSGFYNGVKFHRVIKDFMVQAGDPQSKDDKLVDMWGTGGPGYKFADEIFDPATYRNGYKRGVLAMANSGPNTNGSQFFIMHKDVALPPNYTIFGHVISGIETVDAIANVKTNTNDRPVDPVVISKIIIEE